MSTCVDCTVAFDAESDEAAHRPRWHPDDQLVPALLAGSSLIMADLRHEDRCWAVAGLTVAGLAGEDIRDLLKCSLRLVRKIQAMPLTAACVYMHTETAAWRNERSLTAAGYRHMVGQRDALAAELERTRDKLNRLLDAHLVGEKCCPRCGTPWDKGNTYFNQGKRYCRECNRRRQREFRASRKLGIVPLGDMAAGVGAEGDGVALDAMRTAGDGDLAEHRSIGQVDR